MFLTQLILIIPVTATPCAFRMRSRFELVKKLSIMMWYLEPTCDGSFSAKVATTEPPSSHPFQHTDKTEWRNQAGLQLPKICSQILLVCLSYTVYSHDDQSIVPWIYLCWRIALGSSLQDIVHLIYQWGVSPCRTGLPYQDLNCQPGEDFALFHQIGSVIIIMILLCCGCLHCFSNTLVFLASPHNH